MCGKTTQLTLNLIFLVAFTGDGQTYANFIDFTSKIFWPKSLTFRHLIVFSFLANLIISVAVAAFYPKIIQLKTQKNAVAWTIFISFNFDIHLIKDRKRSLKMGAIALSLLSISLTEAKLAFFT